MVGHSDSARATRQTRYGRALLLGAFCLAVAHKVRGQDLFDRSENISVRDRPRPEYEALGIPIGTFELLPKLTLGAAYNDNILVTESNHLSDSIFAIRPHLDIQSDWTVNKLDFTSGATFSRYTRHSDQDSDQYDFAATGELDVNRDSTLTAQGAYARVLIPRGADEVFSVTPLLYDEASARADLVTEFGHFKLTASGVFEHFYYEDGRSSTNKPIDESFQDRDTTTATVRLDYAVEPQLALFVEEKFSSSAYNRARARNQSFADTLVGPNFEISRLMTAELGVGYLTTSFSDPRAKPVGTFHARAKMLYYPTQLITLTLTADRGVVDSGLPDTPAYVSTTADLQADYELLRNLIITAKAGGIWDNYLVIDRRDRYWSGELSATYLANRGVGVVLSFNHLTRTSADTSGSRSLTDNQLSVAITLQH